MSNSNLAEIGARIRKARKLKRLSQTDLANMLDKSMRTIQKYESGEIEPSIAVINEISKILEVESSYLMGYKHNDNKMSTFSDIIAMITELNEKAGIHFDIDVKRPPQADEWSCSIRFNGNDDAADLNSDLCLFLESFRDERERLETYWSDQAQYDEWVDRQLAYYSAINLKTKEKEELSYEERIRRRDELVMMQMEQEKKKATDTTIDSTSKDKLGDKENG